MSLAEKSLDTIIASCKQGPLHWAANKYSLNHVRIPREIMLREVVDSVIDNLTQGRFGGLGVSSFAKRAKELQMMYNTSKMKKLEEKLEAIMMNNLDMRHVKKLNAKVRNLEARNEYLDDQNAWKGPEDVIRYLAQYYVDDIAADFNPAFFVFFRSVARNRFPNFINSIKVKSESVTTIDKILELQGKEPIVFVPNHVSNADHLPICFAMNSFGGYQPLIAAGANLFKGVSKKILPLVNAYKIRREPLGQGFGLLSRFKWFSNPVYAAVHHEYLKYVWDRNEPTMFYIEGTRSRDGKIGTPKIGIVKSIFKYVKETGRNVHFVPVSLSYNIVPEDTEIEASRTGAEISEKDLFRQLGELNHEYGGLKDPSIYVNFSDPITLMPENSKEFKSTVRMIMDKLGEGIVNTPTYMLASAIVEGAHTYDGYITVAEDCVFEYFGANRGEWSHERDLEEGIASSLHDFEMKGFIEPMPDMGNGGPKHWRILNYELIEQYNNRTAHKI